MTFNPVTFGLIGGEVEKFIFRDSERDFERERNVLSFKESI